MFVQDRMTPNPVTIKPETPFQDALKLMNERGFRRLPVVDKKGKLIGIVTERDLLHASPSPATSLTIWELNYLLSKLEVREIMTRHVITASPNIPIEDAAHLLVDNKIGGLPIVDGQDRVIGIITETDIFKTFVEMFGGGRPGLRLTLEVPEKKGILAELSKTIFDLGGNIVSIGSFNGADQSEREIVVKVSDVSKAELIDTLETLGDHVIDAREQ